MAQDWSPNEPTTVGLEWLAHSRLPVVVDNSSKSPIQRMVTNVTEIIEGFDVHSLGIGGIGGGNAAGRWLLEVYDSGNEIPTGVTTTDIFRPNADGPAIFGGIVNQVGGTPTFPSIDEVACDFTDFARNSGAIPILAEEDTSYEFSSGAFPDGRRVKEIRFRHCLQYPLGLGGATSAVIWRLDIMDASATSDRIRIIPDVVMSKANNTILDRVATLPDINPFTGLPWTPADIRSFDSAVAVPRYVIRPVWPGPYLTGDQVRLAFMQMEVDWVDENRQAYAAFQTGVNEGSGFKTFAPTQEPDGTADWNSKTAGTDAAYSLRRIPPQVTIFTADSLPGQAGSFSWTALDSGVTPPIGGQSRPSANLNSFGCIKAIKAADTRSFTIIPIVTLPATESDDSQAYAIIIPAEVFTGQPAEGEFSGTAGGSYAGLRFLARIPPGLTAAQITGDLEVRIRRRSDNVQFGSTETITPAGLEALFDAVGPDGWRLVELGFSTAAVLPATQYYIDFTSTASGADLGPNNDSWDIAYLSTVPFSTHGDQSYNGFTDQATVNGSQDGDADIPAPLSIPPTPPADFATVIQTQILPGDGGNCSAGQTEFVSITWTATALGVDFLRYEIERNCIDCDPGPCDTDTWELIAVITDESVEEFHDYESNRGVLCCYRMRVIRADNAPSAFTAEECETANSVDCELDFVSNQDPSLNFAYNDQTPREYTFLDADALVLRQLFGRDFQVAAQPLERRGDTFTVELVLFSVMMEPGPNPPAGEGRRVFDILEDMATAPIDYVTVLDSDGNKWQAAIQVPSGNRQEPGKLYRSPILITEITETSSTPDGNV